MNTVVLSWTKDDGLGHFGGYRTTEGSFILLAESAKGKQWLLYRENDNRILHRGNRSSCQKIAEEILESQVQDQNVVIQEEKESHYYLVNPYGWQIRFSVLGDRVTVKKSYRGEDVGVTVMPRAEAREHWEEQIRKGFHKR
jgi:hypothetical protein